MEKNHSTTVIGDVLIGAITTTTIGAWIFQAFSVLLLALIGAFGGWLFNVVIKPKLDKLVKKKADNKAQ